MEQYESGRFLLMVMVLLWLQIAFSGLVYPSLLLAYLGQGAVLLNHPENADDPFYKSVPGVQSHLYVSLILLCM